MIKLGTFNLNNLFSRFNFNASVSDLNSGTASITFSFSDPDVKVKTFRGRLIKPQPPAKTRKIANRIVNPAMDLDILAVQEVENMAILDEFNRDFLGGRYPFRVLVEGNDPRFIDVGILSKYPVGAITSFRLAEHPEEPGKEVFGRDLLEVQILTANRRRTLLTVYNTHLKSHFGDDDDSGRGRIRNDERRRRQAEVMQAIIGKRMNRNARYAVVGDMNDPPDAAPLAALKKIDVQSMFDALTNPTEVGSMKPETNPADEPTTTAWTHRFKASGRPPEHHLFDHIWLSPRLANKFTGAFVGRRKNLGGDGSDHDPAWVELDL